MRIAVGADHGGYPLNERVIDELRHTGHELIDFGTHDGSIPDDYPDYAKQVGEAVQTGAADIGILICGSGVGAAVAANKLNGIRAALCGDTYSARQSREHDDCKYLPRHIEHIAIAPKGSEVDIHRVEHQFNSKKNRNRVPA